MASSTFYFLKLFILSGLAQKAFKRVNEIVNLLKKFHQKLELFQYKSALGIAGVIRGPSRE